MSTSSSTEYQHLVVERKDKVEYLTLNRPEALNALNPLMTFELNHYFDGLIARDDVRIVVLKANGRAFCAGLDLTGQDLDDPSVKDFYKIQKSIGNIMKAMRRCPQPIISLLQGAVCGGGFSIALSSDIRIAAPDCKMNAAYIKIGLTGCDMASSYLLPRLVGTSIASELILTGRFIHADRALRVNLVSDVVPHEELLAKADEFLEDMLLTAPMGLRLAKDGLNFSVDAPSMDSAMAMEDRHQVLLSTTDDHREAVAAFLEKRKPEFTDR